MPVEPCVGFCNDRPCVHVGGTLRRRGIDVEFFEGSVDVVGIEMDGGGESAVGSISTMLGI